MQLRNRIVQLSGIIFSSQRVLAALVVFCSMAALSGCSGGSQKTTPTPSTPAPTPQPPAISSISPNSGTIGSAITIAGSNFGTSQGSSTVTFNGTSAGSASAWSATSITVAVPGGATTGNVVVTVGGVASNGVAFTVIPAVATITVSPAAPSIAVGATQQFTATAKDSNGNPVSGVTFIWASSATSVATIDSSGLATGVSAGTTQITASANSITSNPAATLTVTASASCTSGGSESLLNGSYAFLLKGFDGSGNPALVVGALTFDGMGTVNAGAIDMNLSSGVGLNLTVTSGTYSIGSDQRGCMAITTSAGMQSYRFSVGNISSGVASTGHMIDFDPAGPFTAGTLRRQSGGPFSNASVNGSYAFGGSSVQNNAACASPCQLGIAGVIGFDGKGGITGGSEDFNQNGTVDGNAANTTWPADPISIDSGGTYSISANGRATLTFSVGGAAFSSNTVLYFVSPGEAFFMTTDPQTTSGITAGTALLQSGAPFSANPLSGTYIGYDSGTGITGAGRTDLYLLGPMTAGNNATSGIQFRNTGGSFTSGGLSGGTYSVSPTGRSILAGGSGHAPLLYLVSTSQAFFLQSNLSVDSGFFELQSGSPFSDASTTGTYAYGDIDLENANSGTTSGVAAFTPAANALVITMDSNTSGGSMVGQAENLTYSIDMTGLALIPSGCSLTATPITCETAFYIVSPTKAVSMDLQSANPKIQVADK